MLNVRMIFRREIQSFFNSPMAYIFLVIFAIVSGYFFTNTTSLFVQSYLRVFFHIIHLLFSYYIPAVLLTFLSRNHYIDTI